MVTMSQKSISPDAERRREDHRNKVTGEFSEQKHSPHELSQLGATVWPDDLGRAVDGFPHHWGTVDVEYGARTPWGPAQHAERIAPGIVFVPTAGHGGYKLSKERNAAIPAPYRIASGWYDEDDGARFVLRYHFDAFSRLDGRDRSAELARIDKSIIDAFPDQWEKVNRRTLEPGESYRKDANTWADDNADAYVVRSVETIEDGLKKVTAGKHSTGEVDVFILNEAQVQEARAEAAEELGSDGRFRIPEGVKAEAHPQVEPKPVIPGYTTVPSLDGLTPAAAAKARKDLAQRWRLSATGEALSMRELIERGDITKKWVYINDSGTREFYFSNENTKSTMKVSKALFDVFEAPDNRTAEDHAHEAFRIADAKFDKAQRAVDGTWRPTTAQLEDLRAARKAKDAAYEAWAAIRG